MPKRKCQFRDEYMKDWTFVKRGRTSEEFFCSVCNCYISLSHGGKSDIIDHIKTTKHKSNMFGASTSRQVTEFLVQPNTKEEAQIAAAELTSSYKVIRHHHSFNSLDCTNKLVSIMYPDSKIALKQSTARTKATAIVKHILAPHTIKMCVDEIEETAFYGMSTDASNHKAEKIFPLVVQYFTKEDGITSKLIKMGSLKDETSETISEYCMNTLSELNISFQKCVAFCGDNANTNFGGVNRRGTNNVFCKLKAKMGKDLEGIGCPAHILHNTVSTAANLLSCDVETIVLKIFNYFSIYTIRTEKLKDFCEFVDINYKPLQSHSKTRWISLLPAVERILQLWEPLKSFFFTEEKSPKILLDFFSHPLSEAYFWFLHNQLGVFNRQILKVEGSKMSVIEVISVLCVTLNILKERNEAKFIGLKVKEILEKDDVTDYLAEKFKNECEEFYRTAISYLDKWSSGMNHLNCFLWMTLEKVPEWKEVETMLLYFKTKNINTDIADNVIFDQIVYLKNNIRSRLEDPEWQHSSVQSRWVLFFKDAKHPDQYTELLKLCQYLFAIPAHNANVERIFSLMTVQWTEERNRLSIATVESIIQCYYNLNMTCVEFYNYVKNNKELLKSVKSAHKYE